MSGLAEDVEAEAAARRRRGRPPNPSTGSPKITKVTPRMAYAIREVIEAARYQKKPPLKQIATRRGINHQYLKTWYNKYCRGLVDLSRGDSTLGEPVQKAIDQKLEMARSLNICLRLDAYLNDQLDGAMAILQTMAFEERRTAFRELNIDEHVRLKLSLGKLRAHTEMGYLASVEANERLLKKMEQQEQAKAPAEKELKGEVVSTVVSEVERFRSVFQAAGVTEEEVLGKEANA